MLRQLPLKKEYLLAGAAIVLLLLGYQLAFKKTIEAWQLNHRLKQELSTSADISSEPQYQERKNDNLSRVIDLYRGDTLEFRNKIIGKISAIAEKYKIKLSEVPIRDPLYRSNKFIVQKLKFEGDYFSLIKDINLLQITKNIGVVRSVTFKMENITSRNEKAKNLTMEIYLEIANN